MKRTIVGDELCIGHLKIEDDSIILKVSKGWPIEIEAYSAAIIGCIVMHISAI
jgi:hypothetical protein